MSASKEDTLRDLLNSWLDIWNDVEELIISDDVWERGDDLSEWTRQEIDGDDRLIVRCPNCNSLNLLPCDDLRDDDGQCIEWECDDCGHVINNY